MPFLLDTTDVDERDRGEFVHEALGATMVPIELRWPDERGGVRARGTISDLGGLTICSGRTTAWRVDRTPRLSRDDFEPSIFVNVQHSRTAIVVQDGRDAVAGVGDLVVYDSTAPYTLLSETGMTGDFFRIPHSVLALPHDVVRAACAVVLAPGHPLAALVHDHLRRLAADPTLPTAPDADLLAHPTVELVRAVLLTHAHRPDLAAGPLTTTAHLRVLEYVRRHLHEPDLTAERIAAANHVSVRQLYKVLARQGIGLSDWIRSHRLEAARHALVHAPTTTTIATVARRHGFSDMSAFSRAFRAEFGMTPRQWREGPAPRDDGAAGAQDRSVPAHPRPPVAE